VATQLAAVRGVDIETIAEATSANFSQLFGVAP
jgi:Tat protein secretion system quality control protein TatD with DNase activity